MSGNRPLYKLVLLGDGTTGKTALTKQFCLNHFAAIYAPTIEDEYRKRVQIDGQICTLAILDTSGQQEYTVLRDQWIQNGEGFILVYDVSSRASFSRIKYFHDQIQRIMENSQWFSPSCSEDTLADTLAESVSSRSTPAMLVGNKCDINTERVVSTQEGARLADDLGCSFIETSARTCVNVEKAFHDIVRQLRQQRLEVVSETGSGLSTTDLTHSQSVKHRTQHRAIASIGNGNRFRRGCLGFLWEFCSGGSSS